MSQQLPLQIRKDVRDVFDKEDGGVRESLGKLAHVIGYPVTCEPEWHMIWTELESANPDKTTFVPAISILVEAWSATLLRRLEDDSFAAWTEELLQKLKPVGAVKLLIETSHANRVKTYWSNAKSDFVLLLPKKDLFQISQASSAFAGDFEDIFNSTKDPVERQTHEDDDWADIPSNADIRNSPTRAHTEDRVHTAPEHLPALQTLPRPEILFQSTTPYLLQVSCAGTSKVVINGTHEPSLRLLAEYLQRWIKTDPQDVRKIPYLRVQLHESKFGLGLHYDSLTLEPHDHRQRDIVVNVSLILVFVEGILGYQPVAQTSNVGYWEFKRYRPFATT